MFRTDASKIVAVIVLGILLLELEGASRVSALISLALHHGASPGSTAASGSFLGNLHNAATEAQTHSQQAGAAATQGDPAVSGMTF